jgi:hypothetical protein
MCHGKLFKDKKERLIIQSARVMISSVLPVTGTVLKCVVSYRYRVRDVLLVTKTAIQLY